MVKGTKIEWTDNTFNPWIGCTKVSAGCANCYAAAMNDWRKWVTWGPKGERKRSSNGYWNNPLRWQAEADRRGHRIKVFCASLADIFDSRAPKGARRDLWALIRETPLLDWQILTKRPHNFQRYLPPDWGPGYPNVWLGITTEDQATYNRRWPLLAHTPAAIRFISYEPAVGRLVLHEAAGRLPDWVIWGGESGNRARTMLPDWARRITRQCRRLGIPVFGKQWGTYRSNPAVQERGLSLADAERFDPKSNGKGGALLDGRLWREFPLTGKTHVQASLF